MISLPCLAAAADAATFGIGAALVRDLPDAIDTPVPTTFGFGGALLLPVRFDLAPAAALRSTVRFDVARGSDQVVWQLGESQVGVALVHTFHNIERAELLDPTKNDLKATGNLDPFSRQLALATDVALGAHVDPLWVELGYTGVFLDEARLLKSAPELQVRRAPYGWNALRVALGVSIPLGG